MTSVHADAPWLLGGVTHDRAAVWFAGTQTAFAVTAPHADPAAGVADSVGYGSTVVTWTNLRPDTAYTAVEGAPAVRFRTAPAPAATGRVVFAFGSCLQIPYATNRAPLFSALAASRPELLLWLGDNWYCLGPDQKNTSVKIKDVFYRGDWSDVNLMRKRGLMTRGIADLAPLLGAFPHVAVWDDHDFGFNNAPFDSGRLKPEDVKSLWVGREKAREVFASMWANPPQNGGGPGIQFAFRRGPVAFFLMDDRYHRNPAKNAIWGQEQLTWLMEGLQRADLEGAAVKFVANGTQVIPPTGPEAHTAEGKDELKQLREFIASQKIRNVVFLSGDRHRSEFWVEPGPPALHEFTASPFQHSLLRLEGTLFTNRLWQAPPAPGFGLVTVDVPAAGAGTVQFEVRNASNAVPPSIVVGARPAGSPCAAVLDLKTGRLVR